ncbi:MAG: RNA polymerase sigma factor RpoD/SigA [Spirochaetales bacterium]|nr:RNA polymerase sigma factor RpoD/SigA [Spirochaetales bacterium]MBP5756721.1 RNA polymerase sigma factor RpoD/SigA [Spirochaetales bacterium]
MANINATTHENSALTLYLRDIEKIPLITREEEYELALKAKAGDSYARERLVNGNLRFVVSIAKQYQNRGLPLIDLISEGNIGLLTAIDKFEPEKGYHFISYAVWWIRQSILKAIGEKSRMIRLPMNKSADLIQILQAKTNLEKSGMDDVSLDDIARECGMDRSDVLEIMQIARDVSSLDAPVSAGEDTSYGDFIECDKPRPDEVVMSEALKTSVSRILDTLSEKERGIIKLRFGLDNRDAMSLKEVGEIYHLTKERIRQIEKKVLTALAENQEVKELKAYIA